MNILGILLGDPQRLVHPKDSHGRLCGFDNNLKDKPYLFFFDLTRCANPTVLSTGCPTPQVKFIFNFIVNLGCVHVLIGLSIL